ncbi:hypothetical protein [Ruthenibacterium lactatiformans]|uniref:hypothetical protein n=1 Tax=Ruthenibacterium lactatiformans TaxID=1550024 RepID=UPI00307CB371
MGWLACWPPAFGYSDVFMSIQTSSQGIANQCFDKLLFSKKKLYEFVLLLPVQRAGMTTGVAQPAEFFQFLSIFFPPPLIASLFKQDSPAGSRSGAHFFLS